MNSGNKDSITSGRLRQRFGGPFLTGSEFTAVDAFFCPIAFRAQSYNLLLHSVYIQQFLSLKSMQQWEAAALQETWREPEHEREALAAGVMLVDKREIPHHA